MSKKRKERCPQCGFLEVIRWGKQAGRQRFKCKNCNSSFTLRRKDISKSNRFVWFKWWVMGKQTLQQISELRATAHDNCPDGLMNILTTIQHGK